MSFSMKPEQGFSLLEMAIVLLILGVLAQASLIPLAAMETSRNRTRMNADLQSIRDALIAELVSQGGLPCPVSTQGRQACELRGGLPSQQLALDMPSDASGAALDPWGRRYVYALSDVDSVERGTEGVPDWGSLEEITSVGIPDLRGSLVVCRDVATPCGTGNSFATDLVFVVLSHGPSDSADDLQLLNREHAGSVFTKAPESDVPGHRFDDALVWLSRSEAVWWLLRAHRLP